MEKISSPEADFGFPVEMGPSETSETDARVSADDQADLISVARNFFILAAVIVALGAPLIYRYKGGQSRMLVWSTGVAALVGWASCSVVRTRANLLSREIGLSNRLAEYWGALAVFVAFLALYSTTTSFPTPFNAHVIQAVAFLHGSCLDRSAILLHRARRIQRKVLPASSPAASDSSDSVRRYMGQ